MNEIILYQTENNQILVEVHFEGNTVWLNRQQLSSLNWYEIVVIIKRKYPLLLKKISFIQKREFV